MKSAHPVRRAWLRLETLIPSRAMTVAVAALVLALIGTATGAPTRKSAKPTTVRLVGPVKVGHAGDKLREEVDCPDGYATVTGGYVTSGIVISTWVNHQLRKPAGWVTEVYAPPAGPYGPNQDISLDVSVLCAKIGTPVVFGSHDA